MSYKVSWLVEDRVILVENAGVITLEDLQAIDAQVRIFANAGQAPIHILSDIRYLDKVPFNFSAMRQNMEAASDPKVGWIVEINSRNPIIRRVTALLARIMRVRLVQLATIDEAIAYLAAQDPTISRDTVRELTTGLQEISVD